MADITTFAPSPPATLEREQPNNADASIYSPLDLVADVDEDPTVNPATAQAESSPSTAVSSVQEVDIASILDTLEPEEHAQHHLAGELSKTVGPTCATKIGDALFASHASISETSHLEVPTKHDNNAKIPPLAGHKQMDVAFKNLHYRVDIGEGKERLEKHILKGVSGQFAKGCLTVILGGSGAGKTSLLNALADQTKMGRINGSLFINEKPTTSSVMRKVSAFVHQDDVVLGTMTVQEAIEMSAALRLPSSWTHAQKHGKVEEAIAMLDLDKCRNTPLGTATEKGVSGGERKRACIAMELITDPSIIYLDEPTSGLDTNTALSVVRLLKDLAESGRTVIATLHQPSSAIFRLIDDLCILSHGEMMYFGPASESVAYFARLGYPCPRYSNPADYFFMSILKTSTTGQQKSGQHGPATLLRHWQDSPTHYAMSAHTAALDGDDINKKDLYKYTSTFLTQYPVLVRRGIRNAWRDKMLVRAKVIQTLFMALLLGLIWLNIPSRSLSAQIQDRAGLFFFITINLVQLHATNFLSVFAAEKQVFERELSAGYYGLPAYFLSKITVELPSQALTPLIFIGILYFMAGFVADAGRFVMAYLFCVGLFGCGTAIGTLAASVFGPVEVALVINYAMMLPLMICGGLYVNTANLPGYVSWIKYISPMKYGFTGMLKNEMGGLSELCPDGKDDDLTRTMPCVSPDFVISKYGLQNDGSADVNLAALFGLWLAILALAYLALWRTVRAAKRVEIAGAST
ncbi:hypothetical protein RI367_006727 [Sorochytrium milnesiophthora]